MRIKSISKSVIFLSLAIVFLIAATADAGRHRDKASAENKAACEKWCKKNPNCVKCSTLADCGPGYKGIKSWTGFGDNWHACAKRESRSEASRKNKAACEEWCKKNPNCVKCSERANCGPGFKDIKRWTGKGDNWSACAKSGAGSINVMWPGPSAARKEHRVLVVSLDGHYGYKTRGGFEWFCEDYLSGKSKNSKVLCISSYAAISTRSHKLSDNIAELAKAMKKKSGVRPKIILIGKSMGACKLHHAVTGVKGGKRGKLQDMTVDLFIGIDMSCGVDRHFQKGTKDALFFRNNVKKLLVFYQDKKGESQTGHRGIYVDKKFNPNIHINVNKNSFDLKRELKTETSKMSLCKNVGHLEIDDCQILLSIVNKLILKRAGSTK